MPEISIAQLLVRVLVILIGFTLHELAHAWTADRLGDPTPRRDGRLTLNPVKHIDPLGAILLLVAGFGWAKPVRWNPGYVRTSPRAATILVAGAGPLTNLLLAFAVGMTAQLGLVQPGPPGAILPSAWEFVQTWVLINVLLAVFNLLPIMPLDGYHVAVNLLSPNLSFYLRKVEPYGIFVLVALIILPGNILWRIIGPPIAFLSRTFLGL